MIIVCDICSVIGLESSGTSELPTAYRAMHVSHNLCGLIIVERTGLTRYGVVPATTYLGPGELTAQVGFTRD